MVDKVGASGPGQVPIEGSQQTDLERKIEALESLDLRIQELRSKRGLFDRDTKKKDYAA